MSRYEKSKINLDFTEAPWGAGVVICLELGADLHTAQLMPLPLTVSCFSKIQIDFTFLVPANPGSPGQTAVKQACVWLCCVAVLSYTVASVLRVFCTHFRSCEYFCRTVMPSAHLTANKITWKSASFGTTTQVFYRLDAIPATKPTASKHWRHILQFVQFSTATNSVKMARPT